MKNAIWSELKTLLFLLLVVLLMGYIYDQIYLFSIVFLLGYIAWHWYQLFRFQNWFKNQNTQESPYSVGIWGEVFRNSRNFYKKNVKRQRRLKSSVNRIRSSTAALSDAVILVDRYGRLEWWNKPANLFLGLKYPEDIGQPLVNLVRNPLFRPYFEKANYDEPLSIPSPINEKMELQFKITLFGRKERLIMVQDVTRIKHLEQMRKDFVANVSHELRTPLTVVSGYIETMSLQADTLPPRWKRMLQQMEEQSLRMSSLIRDLLMLSRLETVENNQAEPIFIRPLLEQIVKDARSLSGDKKHDIELSIEQEGSLLGFASELHSAFSNIVFNAIKYTPEGGKIRINWYLGKQCCCLDVIDDGIGIEPYHIPRLTERFYRADPSRSKATGGTGLGLAIAKHVMIHHRARLLIKSEVNKGSTFTCVFPKSRFKAKEPKAGDELALK